MASMLDSSPLRAATVLGLLFGVTTGAFAPASATVRFGSGVFIGGHDFSNQTYDKTHRAVIHLYARAPRHEGCVWHSDRRGGRVKICHLGRIR